MENLEEEIDRHFAARKSTGPKYSPVRLPNEPNSDIVQVRGEDGVFQQGRLVDCAEGGLLIDWECASKPTCHFVPFGEMYLHREVWKKDGFASGKEVPVEVLIRWRSQGPRTWYPGTLVAAEFFHRSAFKCDVSYCLVNASLPDGDRIVVVPRHRIRDPPTEEVLNMLRVHSGHFTKQTVDVPELFCHGADFARQMLEALNRKRASGLGISSQSRHLTDVEHSRCLIRALRLDGKSLTCITMGHELTPKIKKEDPDEYSYRMHLRLLEAAKDCLKAQKLQMKRKLQTESSPEEETDPDTGTTVYNIRLLPELILDGIFEQFDRVEQCELRRVCARWNGILTAPDIVRISYGKKQQSFFSVASLHDGWTGQTRTIIGAGLNAGDDGLLCGGRLFRTLVQKCGHSPVKTIILTDLMWTVKAGSNRFADSISHFVAELNDIAAACQSLLLRNIKVKVHRDSPWSRKDTVLHIVMRRITGWVAVSELWSRMEDNLPGLAQPQGQSLSDWISASSRHVFEAHKSEIVLVLNDRESGDPRQDARYRGRVWTATDLDTLDVATLSKLTLHSLAAVNNYKSLTISLSW